MHAGECPTAHQMAGDFKRDALGMRAIAAPPVGLCDHFPHHLQIQAHAIADHWIGTGIERLWTADSLLTHTPLKSRYGHHRSLLLSIDRRWFDPSPDVSHVIIAFCWGPMAK